MTEIRSPWWGADFPLRAADGTRRIAFGGDYNPEQTEPAVWREDVMLMRRAGVNLVTVGVFAWSSLQPAPDRFDFGWLDEVLGLLHDGGVAVDLATPTASPPPWLGTRHPASCAVDASGVRMSWGSRNHFCPSSPDYRDACGGIVDRLVQRYGDHPAVVMWHVGNEFGQTCYCDGCAEAFRDWLQQRYGSVAALNRAWGTAVWSQTYGDFDQVRPPRTAPYVINPAQVLDHRRFASDLQLDLFRDQAGRIRRGSPGRPVTTNFMGFFRGVDYRRWAAELDVISDDAYPDPTDPASPAQAALTADLMRGLAAGRPWMMMEQAAGAVSWRGHNVPASPERVRRYALRAIGHGADGSCYFCWRAPAHGPERFHAALVPHAGADTATFAATVRLGEDARRLATLAATPVVADVALVFDWPSWWIAEAEAVPTDRLRVIDELHGWYRPLWEAGVGVDVVSATADLSAYRVIIAPVAPLLSGDGETAADLADRWAGLAADRQVVLGPFTSLAGPNAQVLPGRFPAGLTEVTGFAGEEWVPLPETTVRVVPTRAGLATAAARVLAERGAADPGTEIVARFAATDEPARRLDGAPAITRRGHGSRGAAWYVATSLAPEQRSAIVARLVDDAGLDAPGRGLPVDVETFRRGPATFWLNHADAAVRLPLTASARDLLSDEICTGTVTLPPGGARVLVPVDHGVSDQRARGRS